MRRHAKALFAVSVLLSLFAFAPGANAARPYVCQITASASPSASECNGTGNTVPGGAFSNPFALAVDPADNLWVSDTGSSLVDKFDSDGNFLAQADGVGSWEGSAYVQGLAYGSAASLLYAADSNHCDLWGLNPDGTYAGIDFNGLGNSCSYIYAAVDNSGGPNDGDIYVSAGDRVVRIDGSGAAKDFSASEAYLSGSAITGTPDFPSALFAPSGIAVDDNGDVYVVNNNQNDVDRYDSTGTFVRSYKSNSDIGFLDSPLAVAVDPTDDHVLIGSSGNGRVYEFDANGEFRGRIAGTGTPAGSFASIQGLAVDSSGRLWVADGGNGVVDAFGNFTPAGPVATTIDPVTDFDTRSAELSGTVDPGSGEPVTYRFEYSSDGGANWTRTPNQGPISGAGAQSVSASLDGLQPNTTYEVRLFAFNQEGQVVSLPPYPSFTTDAVPPEVGANASSASKTTVRLAGWVNPWGSPTEYRFEYGTAGPCSLNPCASTPNVNAGNGVRRVFAHSAVADLKANTDYHYRLVATNLDGGTVVGEDRTIETSISLPEGRAYEMVSPVTKNGTDVAVIPSRTQSAVDGNAIIFPSGGSFAGPVGANISNEYFARRTSDGWLTHNITPPQAGEATIFLGSLTGPILSGASPDLSTGVFSSPPLPGPSVVQKLNYSLYLRDDLGVPGLGNNILLNNCLAPPAGPCATPFSPRREFPEETEFAFADASEDFGHILFQTRQNIISDAVGDSPKLYEWDHGTVRLAGILPDGTPATCEPGRTCSAPGQGAGSAENPSDPLLNGGRHRRTDTTMSTDGSRVFFTAPPYLSEASVNELEGRLFVREDHETTTQINVSERTDCSGDPTCGGDGEPDPLSDPNPTGPFGASFQMATDDGSKVVFSTQEQLTDDDHNGRTISNDRLGDDFYLADLDAPAGHRLTLISQGTNGAPGMQRGNAVAAISADGSHVYFTSEVQLVAGQPPIESGNSGIFIWHQGEVRYFGEAEAQDHSETVAVTGGSDPSTVASRVGADGKIFSFVSRGVDSPTAGDSGSGEPKMNLTGFDNRFSASGHCPTMHVFPTRACTEVYVYDAEADKLACASCQPLGTRPSGGASILPHAYVGPVFMGIRYNRTLTKDGGQLFFSSLDPLVPTDTNGHYDAYQYDVDSGQVRLLSTGQCSCNSYFVEASPDGSDVFFVTAERLVGIDTDSQADLYDARVGGGIAAQNPPAPFECQGDACQPAPAPPNDPTPASAAFSGAGNAASAEGTKGRKCGKSAKKVRRNGKTRCVAKKRTEKERKRGGK